MSLALWMWKASSRVPSGLRYTSTHALMRAAWLRRSSSVRPASRRCSARRRMKPTTKAPTVPTAEKMLAAVAIQSLAKVRCAGSGEVVLDAHPHGAVHREGAHRVPADPADLAGLVAGGGCTAERAGGEDDGELLSYLAVAGVEDHVARVGVDADQSGHLDLDAGLLGGLPDRGAGKGLAEVHRSAGQRPVVVDHHHVRRRDDGVRLGGGGIVEVVDAACHVLLPHSSGRAPSHTLSKLSRYVVTMSPPTTRRRCRTGACEAGKL